VRALRRLLRPLVRLLLTEHVTFPYLSALLKEVYIDVADRDFPIDGKVQTDSRVSLLTGIHRKDVKRLRGQAPTDESTPLAISLGAQIITRWTTEAEFVDASGAPIPLARQASEGAPSFEQLVTSVSRDIRPRAVLDEWLRLGVAHIDEQDRVSLDASAFIPSKGFDEKAFYFGRNLRDHIAAGAHNLAGEPRPFFDRSVYYNNLSEESLTKLRELAEKEAMRALQLVNERAMKLQASRHFNFGIFLYDEDDAQSSESGGDDAV